MTAKWKKRDLQAFPLVRRRKIFLDGEQEGYLLRSESAQYPETRLTPQQLKKRLLGRVIWIMQEL